MQGARTELGVQGRDQPIAIAVDARRGEVYFQLFDAGGAALTQPQLAPYEAALAQLPQDNYILAGSGGPRLAELGEASATTVPVLTNLEPDAGILAGIAATLPVLDTVKPVYLRAPDAKPQSGKSLPRAPQ